MNEDLSALNLVELYDALIPPAPPPPVSMWPETAGWWWVLAGVVLVIVGVVWRYRVWRRANAYRRAALVALRAACDDPVRIADVLRRTALAGFDRDQVAGLYGSEWLSFLDATAPGVTFSGTPEGGVLATAAYRKHGPNPDLAQRAALWIRSHRQKEGRI